MWWLNSPAKSKHCLPLSHVCLHSNSNRGVKKKKMKLRIILRQFLKSAVPEWLLRQLFHGEKEPPAQEKKRSQHCASLSCEKPFEVSVFSGSPTVHGLEWESVQVFVSVSVQGRMRDGGRFTMATTNAAMGKETESSRSCCNNGGFEEGRWNVIPGCCSEWATSAFWCLVWSTPNGTSVCDGNEDGPALAVHHCATVSQHGDDAGAPLSTWLLPLHYIATLCQYCRVAPSHCFLYRLILPNPGNPTVARVKYQVRAVSPLTFFSNVIFLSLFLHIGLQLWKSDTWQVSVGLDWSNFLLNLSRQRTPYIKWDEAMFRWCNICRSCEKNPCSALNDEWQ